MIKNSEQFFMSFCAKSDLKPNLFETHYPASLGWYQTQFYFDFENFFPDGIMDDNEFIDEAKSDAIEFIKSQIDSLFDKIVKANNLASKNYELGFIKDSKRIVILPI